MAIARAERRFKTGLEAIDMAYVMHSYSSQSVIQGAANAASARKKMGDLGKYWRTRGTTRFSMGRVPSPSLPRVTPGRSTRAKGYFLVSRPKEMVTTSGK